MKKGISLIVLVITIIVIIILAGAVILSLAKNNPIGQANEATRAHDAGEVESALSMYLGTVMGQYKDQVKLDIDGDDLKVLADENGDTVLVVNYADAPLYKNGEGKYEAFDDKDDADAAGYTTSVAITKENLGLQKWPFYPGYYLVVDQFANVKFVTNLNQAT